MSQSRLIYRVSRSITSAKPLQRNISVNRCRMFSTVKFYFLEAKDNNKVEVNAELGKTVLDVALNNDIDIEGACGGELACSTCHVIVEQELFDKLPKKLEEEEDMLDLAYGLTDT